jgi:LAO/AO transport system kinase
MTRRSAAKPSTGDLVERLLNGAPGALAKAITIVENGGELAADILAGIESRRGCALVLGITGAPGAGKSTLLSALVGELRRRGKTVGVLAIDPSSPLTGGAILGDRIRMVDHACDSDVFVRSLASRGHVGGLSAAAGRIVHLMDAAGKDVVIVETVGAGQSDVEVDRLADITIVVCAPGLGDEIQAIKAGILEIADILVVNKADLPDAGRTARQLEAMLSLRDARAADVPVIATAATGGRGIAELCDAVAAKAEQLENAARPDRTLGVARLQIANAAAELVQQRVSSSEDPELAALCCSVQRGELSPEGAARRHLEEYFAGSHGKNDKT